MRTLERAAVGLLGLALIAIMAGSLLLALRAQNAVGEREAWVKHTYQVIDKLAAVRAAITDCETSIRGYDLTADDQFLITFEAASTALDRLPTELDALLADNPSELQAAHRLADLIAERQAGFAEGIKRFHAAGDKPVTAAVPAGKGIQVMAQIRALSQSMRDTELGLLAERTTAADRARIESLWIFLGAGLVMLLVMAAAFMLLRREAVRRAAAEAGIHARERLLQIIFDTVQVGIALTGPDGKLRRVNAAFSALLGEDEAALVGRRPAFFSDFAAPGQARRLTVTRPDGTVRTVLAVASGIVDETGSAARIKTIADVTDLEHAQAELAASHQRLAAINDSVLDGIITINPSGSIESFNRAAETIFGYPADLVMRRNVRMLMPEPFASAHDGYLERYLETGFSSILGVVREVEGLRADGTIFPMEIALTETVLRGHRLFVAAVRDIGEKRALERVKNEFVSTVSHELRTPLTSISGALALMAKGTAGTLPDKALGLVAIARSNCERLVRLINDILDLERIEAGKLVFEFSGVPIKRLVDRAIAENLDFAAKFQVALELDGDMLDAEVWGDEHRLLQVLTNLISNAVKFSPAGGRVLISTSRSSGMLHLAVTDRGRGIPEAFKPRIFQKFAQADATDSRQKGGTGLGLSIVKSIVERHGGRIGFESEWGVGSTFHVDLPEKRARLTDLPVLDGGDKRVLICEDDDDVAQILRAQLSDAGYQSIRAATADETMHLLDAGTFDAMTLDLRLPDGDGIAMLRRIRADARHAGMPVIVISAWLDEKVADRGLTGNVLGVVDWIGKPVDGDRLHHALDLSRRRAGKPRVLHVEDDPDIVKLVEYALRDEADVVAAPSLVEARRRLLGGDIDLIILDVGLVDGSGLTLLDDVKNTKGLRSPPTVLFSAQEIDATRRDELVAVLVKSQSTIDQLASVIRDQLELGTSGHPNS
ncbi:MAG TPA: PAS domain S-box protein [Aliidongia sp.]|uniref:PAS domain S-box protein n=1 Tax=Aliidongia sp. TaxID=1914230 RepID=UPI002DDD3889|nr:PAS domain S-box protein [Aliidongia sp.]HEV2675087.1 PAS domain S-box protein [Aliidongia sp.]